MNKTIREQIDDSTSFLPIKTNLNFKYSDITSCDSILIEEHISDLEVHVVHHHLLNEHGKVKCTSTDPTSLILG